MPLGFCKRWIDIETVKIIGKQLEQNSILETDSYIEWQLKLVNAFYSLIAIKLRNSSVKGFYFLDNEGL